ncbi:uncharacterized protein LOC108135457 isoform X3 [Drosophila elegans]|uniref:uncharacterized protein LOC108135457 isoform X3 n=1 Tax=Drosophila elegans TaxID=30023 RepID=UPI001BC86453|nr:uncharacterized protein LOC108135457 isoform X3 [Drosophila elegans]
MLILYHGSAIKAFNELKENLIAQVEMVQPEDNKECTLTIDASDVAIDAVSSQEDKIPARLVLYFLSWSGFLVSFMMRNDMNFALVAMFTNGNSTQTQQNGSPIILDSIDQWRIVFEVSAIISILTYAVYQIFGTAEIQSWNKELPTHDDSDEGKIFSKPKEDSDKTIGPI